MAMINNSHHSLPISLTGAYVAAAEIWENHGKTYVEKEDHVLLLLTHFQHWC